MRTPPAAAIPAPIPRAQIVHPIGIHPEDEGDVAVDRDRPHPQTRLGSIQEGVQGQGRSRSCC